MKLTKLLIAPRNSWEAGSPMTCTVQLASEKATVETVLSGDDIQRVLDLVRSIVADAAERNVSDFVNAARAVPATKAPTILTA